MVQVNTKEFQVEELLSGSIIKTVPVFLDEVNSKLLYDHLVGGYINFEHSERHLKDGTSYKLPRLQSWMADGEYVKAQLYQKQPAKIWSPEMRYIKEQLEEMLEFTFDYVLINMYRDGKDSIGYHADDEALEPGKNVVASISLGATRTFNLMHSKSKKLNSYKLTNGSLIVMAGNTQKHYKHGVPAEPEIDEPRINLTFRKS